MRERVEHLRQHGFFGADYRSELKEILMAFADSIAKLQAEVNILIAQNGAGVVAAAVAAAVAAKDASDATAVDTVTTSVVAAITPAPVSPAAPVAVPAA